MDELSIIITFFFGGVALIAILLGGTLYDTLYIHPIASDTANDYCKSMGYNQYKSFDRIGLFSKEPVAIKCEYAERYTDLGVRTNVQ